MHCAPNHAKDGVHCALSYHCTLNTHLPWIHPPTPHTRPPTHPLAGGTRTFYLNHVMATGGLKRILLGPGRVPTLAEFTINPGIVVHSIKDVGSYNLEVTLRNTLGRALTKKDLTLPSGSSYSLYFNLMIGVPGLGV